MLARLAEGFRVNENTLALDAVKKIGGNFLGEKHTVENFKTDFFYSELSSLTSYEDLLARKALPLDAVALNRAEQLIRSHKETVTSAEENRLLDEILKDASKELSSVEGR